MDNQEILTPFGYTRHRTETTGQSRMDNQETLTPFGYTRHKTKKKGQSRMDNQETLTLLGTQDTGRRQRDNQEWTIKRH
jgi:hypothetical protein